MKQMKTIVLFAALVAYAVPAMAVEDGVHGCTPMNKVCFEILDFIGISQI